MLQPATSPGVNERLPRNRGPAEARTYENSGALLKRANCITSKLLLPVSAFRDRVRQTYMQTVLVLVLILYLASWLAVPHLLLQDKRPVTALAWLLGLVLLPIPTLPLYLLLGTDRLKRQRLARKRTKAEPGAGGDPVDGASLESALAKLAGHPWGRASETRIFTEGKEFFTELSSSIENAREIIMIQFYTWKNDARGQALLQDLVEAARRGVKVYLLVDELGSLETRESFFAPLVDAGGCFSWFYTVHPLRNRYFVNLRNHRKIACFDRDHAFIGGMNVGDEYEGKNPENGRWFDLHLRVTGSVIQQLEETFANDWHFATQDDPFTRSANIHEWPEAGDGHPAIVVESGPDDRYDRNHLAVGAMISAAKEKIDLLTPYFVPTPELLYALKLASARGVRVRLMICRQSDIRFLIDIGRTFYRELLSYGVRIYEFRNDVNHAKSIRVDRDWYMIGSTNLDVRSLTLNFEANLYGRDSELCGRLDAHGEYLFSHCDEVTAAELENLSLSRRLREGVLRLLAPLL